MSLGIKVALTVGIVSAFITGLCGIYAAQQTDSVVKAVCDSMRAGGSREACNVAQAAASREYLCDRDYTHCWVEMQ